MHKKCAANFTIVFESFSTFFIKIPQFLLYLFYPLIGQLLGIFLCFLPVFIAGNPQNINIPLLFICMIIGLIMFCHAFWQFLLVQGALVLISKQIVENESLREFKYYTEGFKRRSSDYIAYLMLMLLISLAISILIVSSIFFLGSANMGNILHNPVSMASAIIVPISIGALIMLILAPLFTITLQSFVLSPHLSPLKSILKAFGLSIKHYFPLWGLIILVGIVGLVWGQIIASFSKAFIFTDVLVNNFETGSGKEMIQLLEFWVSFVAGNILLPFSTMCYTWYYLKVEKEENAKLAGYRR